jgi:hypothetical protein
MLITAGKRDDSDEQKDESRHPMADRPDAPVADAGRGFSNGLDQSVHWFELSRFSPEAGGISQLPQSFAAKDRMQPA